MSEQVLIRTALGAFSALLLATTAPAGPADDALAAARSAEARLDFGAALSALGNALAAAPDDPAPAIARAALHRKMNRPGLAIEDLGRALAIDPANVAALTARGDLLREAGALARAIADYDAALAATPDHLPALTGRAQALTRSGLIGNARADYDRALALAPDDPALIAARTALATDRDDRLAATLRYDPAALMDPAFRISEGNPAAARQLVIVHAGNALDREVARLPGSALAPARDSGAIGITHLFTYTGQDSAIWANLALICAGPQGFGTVYDALTTQAAGNALDAIDSGGGRAAFEAIVATAYAAAGLDAEASACATDRARAIRYLADWNDKRDVQSWRGASIYDQWPVYVLDGTVVTTATLSDTLAELTPQNATPAPGLVGALEDAPAAAIPDTTAPTAILPPDDAVPEIAAGAGAAEPQAAEMAATAPTPDTDTLAVPAPLDDAPAATFADAIDMATLAAPEQSLPGIASGAVPAGLDAPAVPAAPPGQIADTAIPTLAPDPAEAPDAPAPNTLPDAADDSATAPLASAPAPRPRPARLDDPALRIPAELKGVWASSLPGCIAYSNAIEAPNVLDAALPALNPLDGPALGTVLLTSQRMLLFNVVGTECYVTAGSDDDAAPWRAQLDCINAIAPELTTPLALTRIEADGPVARLSASFGGADPVTLLQCRPLGLLGRDFAPLWDVNAEACTATAPLSAARFEFSAENQGPLALTLAPTEPVATGAAAQLSVAIDDAPLTTDAAQWTGTGWRIALGGFDGTAARLANGLLFEVRRTLPDGGTQRYLLPLLGSGQAMRALAECAAD